MLTLDATQQAIVAAQVKDRIAWLFEITDGQTPATTRYLSTQALTWGGRAYEFAVLPESFRGVSLSRGRSEMGIQAPNDLAFSISNPGNGIDADAFIDGTVLLKLLIKAGASEAVVRAWKFTITGAVSIYQQIAFTCVDFLSAVLDGDYPNTRAVKDIFAGSDTDIDDNVCVPLPFGTAYVPLRSVYVGEAVRIEAATIAAGASVNGSRCRLTDSGSGMGEIDPGRWLAVSGFANPNNNGTFAVSARPDNGTVELAKDAGLADEAAGETVALVQGSRYYVLGDPARTYTIDRVRSPRDCGLKSEWTVAEGYTFRQKTVTDAAGQSWRVMQPIIACSDDSRDVPDAPGFWRNGETFYDMPVRFSRNDTASCTNPADVLSFVLQDMGVAAGDIDGTTQASAAALFASRGLCWNGALWYHETREQVLSRLLNMCHATLRVTDKLSCRPVSRTPVRTIGPGDMATQRSFTARRQSTRKNADCAHVLWQPAGEAQDRLLQFLVPVKSSRSKISKDALELPWVQDSQNAQRLGTLHFQPLLSKAGEISFHGKATLLALEPDDVVTVQGDDYGGIHLGLIDVMEIGRDGAIRFTCLCHTLFLDNWDDLDPDPVTVWQEDTSVLWQPPVSGPLTDKDVGSASHLAWGKEYLTVAPEQNRGRFTNIQDAVNAFPASGGSILLKNGVYQTTAPIALPDRNVEILGESRDGVIIRNAAGQNLIDAANLGKTYKFSNFTVESQNTAAGSSMFNLSGTLSCVWDRILFRMASIIGDPLFWWAYGDWGIHINNASGSFTVSSCEVQGGTTFLRAYSGVAAGCLVRAVGNLVSACACAFHLNSPSPEILDNILTAIDRYGLFRPYGAGPVKVIGNTLAFADTDTAKCGFATHYNDYDGQIVDNVVSGALSLAASIRGLNIAGQHMQITGNQVRIVSDRAGNTAFIGIGGVHIDHSVWQENTVKAAIAGPADPENGTLQAGMMIGGWTAPSGPGYGAETNLISGNRIDMGEAKEGACGLFVCGDHNEGFGNMFRNCATDILDVGTDNQINKTPATGDVDGGEW